MSITLHLGDCREILPTIDRATIGAVIFDPPYGIDARAGRTRGKASHVAIQNDQDTSVRDFILGWANGLPVACWGSWRLPPADAAARIVWDKGHGAGMGDLSLPWAPSSEDCYIFGSGWIGARRGSVLRESRIMGENLSHPHEKPTPLLSRIIETAPPGIILDPTCGSGSTLIAARNMGRDAIGIEIDPKWHRIAKERVAQEVLFA